MKCSGCIRGMRGVLKKAGEGFGEVFRSIVLITGWFLENELFEGRIQGLGKKCFLSAAII